MKNLLLALLLLVSFAASAETDWVIAHTGYNTATIYAVEMSSSGSSTYVSTYNVDSPTTGNLQNIGLPKYLWSELGNSEGVFDTRLVKALSDKEQLIVEIEDLRSELQQITNESFWRGISFGIVVLVAMVLGYGLFTKR